MGWLSVLDSCREGMRWKQSDIIGEGMSRRRDSLLLTCSSCGCGYL